MKKVACAVLILIAVIFLVSPLDSEARGGRWGGHWGGYRGWWAPLAIVGGVAVLAPLYGRYYKPYYSPYAYEPYSAAPTVVIQEQVPASAQGAPPVAASADRLFIYPRQGQNEAQQATDRYECHRWSVGQTGFDPTQLSGGMSELQVNQKRGDYHRALSACLDGRGYTMK